jgi:hypothetical protein
MKKAIVSYQGYVSEIRDPGEDYEIYEGPDATIAWVDAPDNIQLDWTLEWSPSRGEMIWIEREGGFTNNAVARKVAYGEIGEQLGMIFDDIKENGSLDQNSAWFQHIVNVKTMIEKPVIEEPISLEELMLKSTTEEPSVNKPCVPSTPELQSWIRYPGWKGYQSLN